ncbi:isoprenylcysteine carboxylmethyltransferase family protein [Mannheimia pernigra]|uniref:Isoprenylcysteine carboxylmethyltransferase family protein n=1 Tax=Mannheimia pernigra TaxID=111844 RepID=A0ABD7A6L0_9PAST|nr:isoprenylcysteine carboxylmethyltransferase family protein [Mannheimia pernigra]QLB41684.1 isoprenylcysteine carboxylmethyltransferase family protein [Mannheimia pernigra]
MFKLKIPPPLLFLLCTALMLLIKRFLPAYLPDYRHIVILILGTFIIIMAVIIAVLAVITIRKAKTTMSPFLLQNTTQMVTWGIYSKSRNPMYLSLLLGLIAWAIWLGSIWVWFVLPLFIWLITYFQIKPEEQILTQKFGQRYLDYSRQVRRWW